MFLFKSKKKKPLILTIHGFGKKRHQEFDPLCQYLKVKGWDCIQFDIYSLKDPEDAHFEQWIQRCEEQIRSALSLKRPIILIGFSMGGVIASYLASVYPVQSLILVAPAFRYFDLQKLGSYSWHALRKLTAKEKSVPSSLQTRSFMDVVDHYKDSVYHVSCPLLILHGTKDEVIPYESSRNIYNDLQTSKKCLLLIEGGKHRMLYDGLGHEKPCFKIIESMLNNELL